MSTTASTLANRHIAKLLDNLERLVDMTPLAKTAVKQELHWLAEDVESITSKKASTEQVTNGKQHG